MDICQVAGRIENDVNGLQQRIAGRDRRSSGQIRVAVVDTLLNGPIVPLFKSFRAAYPDIMLDILVGVSMVDLSKREADVAIRAGGTPPESLVGRKLCGIAVAIYQCAAREPVNENHLADYPWVVPNDSLAHLASARWLKNQGLEASAVMRANSLMTLCTAVSHDIGIAILPCYIADLNPMLKRVGKPIEPLRSNLWFLMHPEIRKASRIKNFAAQIEDGLRPLRELFEGRQRL